jgi:hypothetical protein
MFGEFIDKLLQTGLVPVGQLGKNSPVELDEKDTATKLSEAIAKEMAANDKLSYPDALDLALLANPALWDEYRKEVSN